MCSYRKTAGTSITLKSPVKFEMLLLFYVYLTVQQTVFCEEIFITKVVFFSNIHIPLKLIDLL